MAGRLARYRALFDERGFLPFFISLTLGEAGYAVYAIGVLWLALTISHSPIITGIVLGVEFGIYALSFTAGPFVDRAKDLRSIILTGYAAQGVVASLLAALALLNELNVPILLGLIVALSVLWNFTWTAMNAVPPRLVATDRLFLANGLLGAASGGNQIAGYAAGGALILLVGSPGGAMLLYGALNFAAAVCAIPLRSPSAPRAATRFLDEMREGWAYLFGTRDPPLRTLTTYVALQAFFSAAAPLVITFLAYRSFPDPTRSYGLLFTSYALGGVAGSLVLGEVGPRRWIGWTLIAAGAAEGLLLPVAIGVAPSVALSLPAWAGVGFADVAFYETYLVFLQATTPTVLLGRTFTNTYLFRGSSRAAGAFAVGILLVYLSPGVLGWVLAAFFLGVAFLVPAIWPRFRRLGF